MKKELKQFYDYLENKNYSVHTIKSYKEDLEQFNTFCNNKNIKDIDYKFIRTYINFLYEKKYNL